MQKGKGSEVESCSQKEEMHACMNDHGRGFVIFHRVLELINEESVL